MPVFGGTYIHRTADTVPSLPTPAGWNGSDSSSAGVMPFETRAEYPPIKLTPTCLCRSVQGLCDGHKIFRSLACSTANQSDRCHGNSLIDDRNSVIHAQSAHLSAQDPLPDVSDLVIDLFDSTSQDRSHMQSRRLIPRVMVRTSRFSCSIILLVSCYFQTCNHNLFPLS